MSSAHLMATGSIAAPLMHMKASVVGSNPHVPADAAATPAAFRNGWSCASAVTYLAFWPLGQAFISSTCDFTPSF
jgi:hypothetical protein